MNDIAYTRLVNWLKVILPLLALAVLSTLFLVARTVDPAQQLPFAEVDVDELAREERIGAPNFTGVTAEGAAIAVSAQSAAPDPLNDGRMTGETVEARITLPGGEAINISAAAMELNTQRGLAELRDNVLIESSAGYTLVAERLEVALDRTFARAPGPVTLQGGLGQIQAGSFELKGSPTGTAGYVLVFKDKVRLLYQPGS